MEKIDIIEYLSNDPGVFLEVVAETLNKYHGDHDFKDISEVKRQLAEVSKAIKKLEKTGTAIPVGLLSLKSSLITSLNSYEQVIKTYNTAINGLNAIISEYSNVKGQRAISNKRREFDATTRKHKGSTSSNTMIKAVVKVLEEMGNSGRPKDVYARIAAMFADVFTPEDYRIDDVGRTRWKRKVYKARKDMVKNGILRRDSPNGIWELSNHYQELLEGNK